MNITTLGTITISEDAVTFSGWGNITRAQEFIIKDWAIERLIAYPALTADRKRIDQAVFPGYTPTV